MKKIVFALLASLVLLSCAKDSDDLAKATGTLTPGMYLYYGAEYAIAISTTHKYGFSDETFCEAGYITVTKLKTAEYVFTQKQGIKQFTKDDCSGYEYNNGLKILCVPNSEKRFTGMVLKNISDIQIPDEMEFNLME